MLCCLFHRSLQCQCFGKLCTSLATFRTMRLHLNMELSCTYSQINSALFINITLFWPAVNTSRPVWGGHVIWLALPSPPCWMSLWQTECCYSNISWFTCIAGGFYINEVHPSYHNKANGRQLNLISGPLLRQQSAGLVLDWRSRPGRPIHVNMFHGQLKQLIIAQSDKWSQVFS